MNNTQEISRLEVLLPIQQAQLKKVEFGSADYEACLLRLNRNLGLYENLTGREYRLERKGKTADYLCVS